MSIKMQVKQYIHDKFIVFLSLVVILLGVFNSLLVLLRVDTTQAVAIIRNNTSLGLAGFEKASSSAQYQFIFISIVIMVGNLLLAIRIREIKRSASIFLLGVTTVIQLFLIVVSTAILGLNR